MKLQWTNTKNSWNWGEKLNIFPVDLVGIINTEEPLYGQIVKCFAEDAALGDAIYHLGEGLRLGLIPSLDLYLKKVRNLSRQQFYLRATMIKARQKSGLDD